MKTLKETACGQTVKVKRLHGEGPVKRLWIWALQKVSMCMYARLHL